MIWKLFKVHWDVTSCGFSWVRLAKLSTFQLLLGTTDVCVLFDRETLVQIHPPNTSLKLWADDDTSAHNPPDALLYIHWEKRASVSELRRFDGEMKTQRECIWERFVFMCDLSVMSHTCLLKPQDLPVHMFAQGFQSFSRKRKNIPSVNEDKRDQSKACVFVLHTCSAARVCVCALVCVSADVTEVTWQLTSSLCVWFVVIVAGVFCHFSENVYDVWFVQSSYWWGQRSKLCRNPLM